MIPMALLTFLAIYLVYLRRVPRTVGETGRSKKECVRLLLRSLWSLLLAIAVIIVFSLPTWAVVAVVAAVNALVEKFSHETVPGVEIGLGHGADRFKRDRLGFEASN